MSPLCGLGRCVALSAGAAAVSGAPTGSRLARIPPVAYHLWQNGGMAWCVRCGACARALRPRSSPGR
eukprot:3408984-Pyramimonas_sp.AAC.1